MAGSIVSMGRVCAMEFEVHYITCLLIPVSVKHMGSCQIYGSTVQLVGGVVTSHPVDLELIHTAEACTPADHML